MNAIVYCELSSDRSNQQPTRREMKSRYSSIILSSLLAVVFVVSHCYVVAE